jgi:hypothetical protein
MLKHVTVDRLWNLAITVLVFWALIALYDEGQTRTHKFCQLTAGTHVDRIKRYRETIRFLETPAGREHTTFNDYIRQRSLPQTYQETLREWQRFPSICLPELPEKFRAPKPPPPL